MAGELGAGGGQVLLGPVGPLAQFGAGLLQDLGAGVEGFAQFVPLADGVGAGPEGQARGKTKKRPDKGTLTFFEFPQHHSWSHFISYRIITQGADLTLWGRLFRTTGGARGGT